MLLAGVAASTACGPGLSDLSAPPEPLATITVRLDLGAARRRLPRQDLYVGIAWGAAWENPAICYLSDNPVVQLACRDPFLFLPGLVEARRIAAGTADGIVTMALPISELPNAAVLIGDERGKVGYASVAVLTGLPVAIRQDGSVLLTAPYQVAAASLIRINRAHDRLVFRQGEIDSASSYYPYPTAVCGEPPPGLSWLETAGDGDLTAGSCGFAPIETLMTLANVQTDEDESAWQCVPSLSGTIGGAFGIDGDRHRVEQPPDDDPIGEFNPETHACIGSDVLVSVLAASTDSGSACPEVRTWALAGCHRNVKCTEVDWDVSDDPPAWWPCP
ncbi:MAG: hypothetical protein HY903_00665 [Deltaproteobacteria bacterium]|nr:hypothetical protein [Deltaproteobacteria bacterium]